ncbi:MAG: formimidoylglutamase [Sinomicrobium sp.]|nr:formimidoylglutamase [Sinomicrobium sp.]
MDFEFLLPVSNTVLSHSSFLHKQTLGKTLKIHTKNEGFPEMDDVRIALFCVNEFGYSSTKFHQQTDISGLRIQLYKLYAGNWNTVVADLGDIAKGATPEDTDYAVKTLVAYLVTTGIVPVVIGGSQEITYATYRAFDALSNMVNIVAIDSCFDFGFQEELISSQSYMGKIILEKPNNLFNFCNLGYQTYYNAQETIDLIDNLFFEAYRLGEITKDIAIAEPVLRDADIVSLDVTSVKSSDLGYTENVHPNGFNSREICAISRYAGISDRVSVFGIYEFEGSALSYQLIAQIIWYFIEGYNFRTNEYPFRKKNEYTRFMVPVDNETLNFYKSDISGRWWIEVPSITASNNKLERQALLPCTHQDYLDACNQVIPQRWWKAYRKAMN